MTPTLKRFSKKEFERAQLLFFSGRTVQEISFTLNLDAETLRFYVFGEDGDGKDKTSWHYIKGQMNPTAMAIYMKDKCAILDQTAGVALEVLSMGLSRLRHEMINNPDYVLDVDSMSKLSSIQVNLDKVARLETGKATEIMEHMGLSLTDAKEIMQSDPFAQAIEAEVITREDLPWLDVKIEE